MNWNASGNSATWDRYPSYENYHRDCLTQAEHTGLFLPTHSCLHPYILPKMNVWERPIWKYTCSHPLWKPAWMQRRKCHPTLHHSFSVRVLEKDPCVHTRNAWECVPVYKLIFIKSVRRRKKMQCYSQRICLAFDWVVVLFRGAKVASDLINKHEEIRKCSQAFAASSANMSAWCWKR